MQLDVCIIILIMKQPNDLLCILSFHNEMWHSIGGGGKSREITRVFHLQKKIMRIVTGVNSRSSCRPILKALKYCW
jgi:hypothetical protein